jgi:hypothetical protein
VSNRQLCLVPHTSRFLGQRSLGCRTDGEQCRCFYLQSDEGRIAAAKRFFLRLRARILCAENIRVLFGQAFANFFYSAREHSTKMLRQFRVLHSGTKNSPAETSGLRELACLLFAGGTGTCQQLHSPMPKKVGPQRDNAVKSQVVCSVARKGPDAVASRGQVPCSSPRVPPIMAEGDMREAFLARKRPNILIRVHAI